jgi:hypothetical protein
VIRIPPPTTRHAGAPDVRARALFRWQARALTTTAITGQEGALVRAATGTAVDSTGATYTAVHSMPRWESRTFGDGARVGLRLAADDLAWPVLWTPRTASLLVECAEAGTRTTAGAGLLYVGNDAQSGARWTLDSTGTNYRATVHNGTTSVSATLSTATPTTGQGAYLLMQVEDTGTTWRVRLLLSLPSGFGETVTGWSSTIARAATFGAAPQLRLNRVGSAGTPGSTWVAQVAVVAGLRTTTDVLEDC